MSAPVSSLATTTGATTTRALRGLWLGRRPYGPVHQLQEQLFEARRAGAVGDTVLFLEHDPVVTRGRGARADHLLASANLLAELGVDLADTARGGDVTLHLPGQLVAYPILDLAPDLRDVRRYVRTLAAVMQRVCARSGLATGTIDEYIGLWADASNVRQWPGERAARTPVKVGAIGVRISRWITMHGFALNLSPDLSLFRLIVPCGIREHGVGSVAQLTGEAPSVREAAHLAFDAMRELFGGAPAELIDVSGAPLSQLQPPSPSDVRLRD
jgi:lipoyl(octanoyl) transferase